MNTLIVIRPDQMHTIQKQDPNAYSVQISGSLIQSWNDYWNAMSAAFRFPDLPSNMEKDYHSYYDLMTDLSWLSTDEIYLFIEDSDRFLREEPTLKEDLIHDFQEYLLPFWESEVEQTVVGGKKKMFNVYLVSSNE